MGEKKGTIYPTYLAGEKGMRGYDYRSPGAHSLNGIALIICAPFSDVRDRIQGLLRVGRQGDGCYRLQDTTVQLVDTKENAIRKGKLA